MAIRNGSIENTKFSSVANGAAIKKSHLIELRTAFTKLETYSTNVDNCGNCTYCQTCDIRKGQYVTIY